MSKVYKGIHNSGNICYIIALLQQLYMIPTIRYKLINFDQSIIENLDFNNDDCELLLKLIDIFKQLDDNSIMDNEDISNSVNIDKFCESFKDNQGKSININKQRDIIDFFNHFISKLHKLFTIINCDILSSSIAGELTHTIKPKDYINNIIPIVKSEVFYYISVKINESNNNLHDSLVNYIRDIDLSYKWNIDNSNENLPSIKSVKIKTLPNHLFIYLRRFEFDYYRNINIKINSTFIFPFSIDMSAYMEILDNQVIYELAGVILHEGTSQSGHYYSIIKVRDSSDHNKWLLFDDEEVDYYNINNLQEESFGSDDCDYSAFVLIYDRNNISFY